MLVSQYVAFLDGRIEEVAYDLYAQADDGSVWYFGEDVFNFADGVIVDTHGTWIAGQDGPAAMIMPGDPQVGEVYRPENIPGFVFEEVTVKSVNQTLDGPFGPIDGGLLIEELHMDGAARSEDWDAASRSVEEMSAAWDQYRSGDVPVLIEPLFTDALDSLKEAVDARDTASASQAAISSAQMVLDLQLRHRPVVEVDLERFDLWLAQLLVDAATRDAGRVNGDFFTIDYIRDRVLPTLEDADFLDINTLLEELQGAVGDADFSATIDVAGRLRSTLAGVGG